MMAAMKTWTKDQMSWKKTTKTKAHRITQRRSAKKGSSSTKSPNNLTTYLFEGVVAEGCKLDP